MPRLSVEDRNHVINLRDEGHGYGTIGKKMMEKFDVSVTKRAVRMIIKKFDTTGSLLNKKRSSVSKLEGPTHEEFVDNCLKTTPDMSANVLKEKIGSEFQIDVSKSTVSRYRKNIGWKSHRTRYCQMIRDVNKEKRKAWCEVQIANQEQFDDVVFTDESKIELSRMCRRSFRKEGESLVRQPKPKHPFSMLVWGGISKKGATPLLIFNGIMDSDFFQEKILGETFLPFVRKEYPGGHRLYQDNDPKHTSKSTQKYMKENNIVWWKSPAESPDINPIENLWAEMKYYISSQVKPKNKQELEDGLHRFWKTVTPAKCQKYIGHIHKVLPKVVECQGGPTGF